MLDFAAQKGNVTHTFAQIVTASEHVVGYSINTGSLQATKLWQVSVRLYGSMAAPIVQRNRKGNGKASLQGFQLTGGTNMGRPNHNINPVNWPASIAVNKRYMLVTRNMLKENMYHLCCFFCRFKASSLSFTNSREGGASLLPKLPWANQIGTVKQPPSVQILQTLQRAVQSVAVAPKHRRPHYVIMSGLDRLHLEMWWRTLRTASPHGAKCSKSSFQVSKEHFLWRCDWLVISYQLTTLTKVASYMAGANPSSLRLPLSNSTSKARTKRPGSSSAGIKRECILA